MRKINLKGRIYEAFSESELGGNLALSLGKKGQIRKMSDGTYSGFIFNGDYLLLVVEGEPTAKSAEFAISTLDLNAEEETSGEINIPDDGKPWYGYENPLDDSETIALLSKILSAAEPLNENMSSSGFDSQKSGTT